MSAQLNFIKILHVRICFYWDTYMCSSLFFNWDTTCAHMASNMRHGVFCSWYFSATPSLEITLSISDLEKSWWVSNYDFIFSSETNPSCLPSLIPTRSRWLNVNATKGRKKIEGKIYLKYIKIYEEKGATTVILTTGDQVPRCRRRNGSHQLFGSKGSIFCSFVQYFLVHYCLFDWLKVSALWAKRSFHFQFHKYLIGKFWLIVLLNIIWSVWTEFDT